MTRGRHDRSRSEGEALAGVIVIIGLVLAVVACCGGAVLMSGGL